MTIGVISPWFESTPPQLWVFCDGQVYSASQYPEAAAVLGSRYGGNGSTTFGVPNLSGRTIKAVQNPVDVGQFFAGRSGTTSPINESLSLDLGQSGASNTFSSSATFTFSSDNSHTHSATLSSQSTGGTSLSGAGHQSTVSVPSFHAVGGVSAGVIRSGVSHTHSAGGSSTTNTEGNHTHQVSFSGQSFTHSHSASLSVIASFDPLNTATPKPRRFSCRFIIKLLNP